MQASTLTALFLLFLGTNAIVRIWLAQRQIRHVQDHRDQVPAEFADRISLRSHQRAADYTTERTRLRIAESVFDVAVLLVLTMGGVLGSIYHVFDGWFASTLWRDVAFIAGVSVLLGAVHMPFSLYRQFKLEQKYGFNRMTPKLFMVDTMKGLTVGAVLGLPLLTLILWLMDSAGTNWWIWAWASWAAFNFAVMLIFPTWIAPLFNKFTPLQDESLKDRINALAKRCDFAIQGLFVMDGSKRSAHGNAYFTGFGKSRRIVFFDTLLAKLTPTEIEAVLAHELGHFKHKHIVKRLAMSLLTSLLMFALLGWLAQQYWFYAGLGVTPLADGNNGVALLLFFLVLPVFTFLLTPVTSWLSRRDEFEADRFAASQSPSTELVSALVKLFNDNAATLTPDPVHSAFYDSHPPATIRIRALAAA
ncbi:MAG: M48 family metallopeptidase [Burkholderiaceae bacterium]|nr:M48 family metallopeptidase [Burkholderiaceae bacterium]MCD8536751.1 M48 family metallopeptidase [Burkholderiaceae bacterium]